jgi:hypothetical protein
VNADRLRYISAIGDGAYYEVTVQMAGGGAKVGISYDATVQEVIHQLRALCLLLEGEKQAAPCPVCGGTGYLYIAGFGESGPCEACKGKRS